jgi:hypothetical protein
LLRTAIVLTVTAGALVMSPSGLAAGKWSSTTIDLSNPPLAVSCPSSSFCGAIGVNGVAQTFNGSSWSTPAPVETNEKVAKAL